MSLISSLCRATVAGVLVALSLPLAGCSGSAEQGEGPQVQGRVAIDGSSTVFPITEAVAEEFEREYRQVRVTVGISGTGGGFKRFVVGETDISDASGPIKPEEYQQAESGSSRSPWPMMASPSS